MTARRDILVIKLSALGDFVLAMPAFARIRAAHPNEPITLLTTPPYEALAKASPWFDRVWTDGRPRGALGWLRLIGQLRAARFTRVYDLQTNDRTNLIFQALRPFPPAWSGTAAGCGLPDRNPDRMKTHSLERHAAQLQAAGIWPDAPTSPGSSPAPDVSWLVGDPPPRERLALLIPGAAAHRPAKRWPVDRYGEIASRLISAGWDVAVIGSEQEGPLAEAIRARSPAARDLTGQTRFEDIARLGARAELVVANDTGPAHLTAAAGAPTVSLFSADSDPVLSAPRGPVTILRSPDLAELPVDAVWSAVRQVTHQE